MSLHSRNAVGNRKSGEQSSSSKYLRSFLRSTDTHTPANVARGVQGAGVPQSYSRPTKANLFSLRVSECCHIHFALKMHKITTISRFKNSQISGEGLSLHPTPSSTPRSKPEMKLRLWVHKLLGQGFQKLEHYKQTDTQTHVTGNITMPYSQVVKLHS